MARLDPHSVFRGRTSLDDFKPSGALRSSLLAALPPNIIRDIPSFVHTVRIDSGRQRNRNAVTCNPPHALEAPKLVY